jgi:hypothetical protein
VTLPLTQLLVFGFGPDADFEGQLVGAVLVEHAWARALEEAMSRTGGTPLASDFVDATELAELASDLLAAARRRAGPNR